MTPTDLRAAGEALYGESWHGPLARALGVAVRTVQRWDAGERGVPNWLHGELSALIQARIRKLEKLVA